MLSQQHDMPSGKPKPFWQPALAPIAGGQSSIQSAQSIESVQSVHSIQSDGSFASQAPMPYHQAHVRSIVDDAREHLYAGNQYQANPFQTYGAPVYATSNSALQSHLLQATPVAQKYARQAHEYEQNDVQQQTYDYTPQFPRAQGAPSTVSGDLDHSYNTPNSHLALQAATYRPPLQDQYSEFNQYAQILSSSSQGGRPYSPAESMNSYKNANFGSALLHNVSETHNANLTSKSQGRSNYGQNQGHQGRIQSSSKPIARPQRQPFLPQEQLRGSGFVHRDKGVSSFNPNAAPYAPASQGQHSHQLVQSTPVSTFSEVVNTPEDCTPRAPSRAASRPTSRNSAAEARRDSHDNAVMSALASTSLSSKGSRSSLNGTPKTTILYEGGSHRTPQSVYQILDNFEDVTPTRPFSRSRLTATEPQGSRVSIDPIRGPPPAFQPAASNARYSIGGPPRPASAMDKLINPSMAPHLSRADFDPFVVGSATPTPTKPSGNQSASQFSPAGFLSSSVSAVCTPTQSTGSNQSNIFAPLSRYDLTPTLLQLASAPKQGPSNHLAMIVGPNNVKPTIDVAFQHNNMPFVTSALTAKPATITGLVRISNIPYSVTRQEIIAFIGRNARIIKDSEEPIHIIMERVTSKTMDAYIEFISPHEAINCVSRYEMNRSGGRGGRLGERHVDLEIVGHEQLMKDLFPKAKNVLWQGSIPTVLERDPEDGFNSGFQGFLIREELVMLVKHVEAPSRSPFAKDCPQRPFECLISTLWKYPWYMVDHITIEDRDLLFHSARRLAEMLCGRLAEGDTGISIDHRLLNRVKRACLMCPGFSEAQKDDIAYVCGMTPLEANIVPFADQWCVFRAIGAKPGITPDVLEYYQALLREATTSSKVISLAVMAATATGLHGNSSIFGKIEVPYPKQAGRYSLAEIARFEWEEIERLLRTILPDDRLAIEN